MLKKGLILTGLVGLIVLIGALLIPNETHAPETMHDDHSGTPIMWHAIDVSGKDSSGDAHLFLMPDGTTILLDTGYERFAESSLIPTLKSLNIGTLDLVLISHAHKNHYGSLPALAKHFEIKAVMATPPDAQVCATEADRDRCNLAHFEEAIAALPKASVGQLTAGQKVYVNDNDNISLSVLHQGNSLREPLYESLRESGAKFTINDSSAVLQLNYGDTSVLLPGDIGPTTGAVLVDNFAAELNATLLAAPHHGVTPLPAQEFFELVSPEAIIVSVSLPPYVGKRGEPIRDYAQQNQVPLYVTGRSGSIVTTIFPDSFQMQTEK